MKYLSAMLLVVACFSLCSAQPKIWVDKHKIDWGTVYNGTTEQARVTVKNVGKDTLRILGVYPSCGCTTVKQLKTTLRPGESDVLEFAFNSTGYRGKVVKYVTIMTNDPTSSQTLIALNSDVIDELAPLKGVSVIWLGTIPLGKEVNQTFSFKNVSGKTITLKDCRSSSGQVTATFDRATVLPADTVQLFIKVKPTKADYSSEQLLLETDSKKQREVPLRVTFIGVKPN
jgi:hypothetical protein